MSEVGRGGCCAAGRGVLFAAPGYGSEDVYAYIDGEWEDLSGEGIITEAGAMAYEVGTGRRLFVLCDGDENNSDSLHIFHFDGQTGIEGDWATYALPAPVSIERGIGLAFAPTPDNPVLSGYLYMLRGGNTRDLLRRRFTRSNIVPDIAGPMDGAGTKPSYTPLDWRPTVAGAEYQVQIDESSAFDSPVLDTSVSVGELVVPNGILSSYTTYYWRVRAATESKTYDWSNTEHFVTNATSATGGWAVFPPDDALTSGDETFFDWPNAAYAVAYELIVKPLTSGTAVIDETLAVSEYSSQDRLDCGNYQWKYRSKNQYNVWSSWSNWYDLDVSWSWETMASIPSTATVDEGGALCLVVDYHSDTSLVALVGNGSTESWRYEFDTNSWDSLARTPDDQNGGAALAAQLTLAQYVNALCGEGAGYHSIYSTTGDWWGRSLTPLPRDCVFGSCLGMIGDTLYLIVAGDDSLPNDTFNFFRFEPGEEEEGGQARSGTPAEGLRASVTAGRDGARVSYTLAHTGRVRVDVLDLNGRAVALLADSRQPAGRHVTRWQGLDSRGARVPGGVYFVRLETPDGRATLKTVLER